MSDHPRGILQMIVDTPQEAANAVAAVYGDASHECAGWFYLDADDAWYQPLAFVQFGGGREPEPSPPPTQEPHVNVLDSMKAAGKKAAVKVGLAESDDAKRYRELRQIIDGKPEAIERMKAASKRPSRRTRRAPSSSRDCGPKRLLANWGKSTTRRAEPWRASARPSWRR